MFKSVVLITVSNVKYLLSKGYTVEKAIQTAMSLVEMPEWLTVQVRQTVENKFMNREC